jgi:hypothetical protein
MAAVRRLFAWMAGLAGIAALARVLSARRARVEGRLPPTPPGEDDPAEALRQKLSEARGEDGLEPPTVATAAGEPSGGGPSDEEPTETLDERRARIHAKAREAIDAMQDPPG